MGIQIEFCPDLALRDISEYKKGKRKIEECIPENLKIGKIYNFLKKGQRNYWILGEVPLVETKGEGKISRPKASVVFLEVVHCLINKEIYTKGRYKVIEKYENDNKIHFCGFEKI